MNGIQGCPHIGALVAAGDVALGPLRKFKEVVAWEVRRLQGVKNSSATRKVSIPTCGTCKLALHRPSVCLHCPYAGCWKSGHVSTHLQESQHSFCADVKTGSVFCFVCRDFIYHAKIDELYLASTVTAEEEQTRFQVAKKHRERFQSWAPTAQDVTALENALTIPCQGRRGLLNLGQTCFMNVVLQSFVHNPLLRNYFLGDNHNNKQCEIEEDCTCCEMDKLFAEIFSDEPTAYGPINFLATTLRKSVELSGYQQQDAHEFFISTLNNIHTTSRGSTNVSCNCIVHSTFAVQLQSDVVCERCGNVTSAVDPMLDISLELRGKAGEVMSGDNTLTGCLKRYTQPEKLDPKQYKCAKCGRAAHVPNILSQEFSRHGSRAHMGEDTRIALCSTQSRHIPRFGLPGRHLPRLRHRVAPTFWGENRVQL
ncbi:hypothetical protein B0H11DRAFT_1751876 [Mycena galericulata]|nr:hypothetical protein B0H11DRAFT_1751876 [Mycena galericulata]